MPPKKAPAKVAGKVPAKGAKKAVPAKKTPGTQAAPKPPGQPVTKAGKKVVPPPAKKGERVKANLTGRGKSKATR